MRLVNPSKLFGDRINQFNSFLPHEVKVSIRDKKIKLSADKLLLSVGIKPNVEDLGLESLNIKMEKDMEKEKLFMMMG